MARTCVKEVARGGVMIHAKQAWGGGLNKRDPNGPMRNSAGHI